MPHHQDTGGFFVAVLEKTKPLPGEKVYKDAEGDNPPPSDTATQRTRQVSDEVMLIMVFLLIYLVSLLKISSTYSFISILSLSLHYCVSAWL